MKKVKVVAEPNLNDYVAGVDPIPIVSPTSTPTFQSASAALEEIVNSYATGTRFEYKWRTKDDEPEDDYNADPDEEPEVKSRDLSLKDPTNDLLRKYVENYDDTESLLKLVFTSGVMTSSHNAVLYDPVRVNNDIVTLRASNGRNINNHANNINLDIRLSFENSELPSQGLVFDQKTSASRVLSLVEDIYLSNRDEKCFMRVNTKEELLDIMTECKARGIKIDPELIPSNFDFKALRRTNCSILIAYFGIINELFLISSSWHTKGYQSVDIYELFSKVPPITWDEPEKSKDDLVNISGKEFSRKVVETIIECNFDEFYDNLLMESYLNDRETDKGSAILGDNDSLEDLKLI